MTPIGGREWLMSLRCLMFKCYRVSVYRRLPLSSVFYINKIHGTKYALSQIAGHDSMTVEVRQRHRIYRGGGSEGINGS